MKEVRAKGKLQKSSDVTAWLGVGAVAVMLPATIAAGTSAAVAQFSTANNAIQHPDAQAAVQAIFDGMGSIIPTIGTLFAAVAAVILAGSAAQGGIHFKTQILKFEQFDFVKGIGRTFGTQALWQGAKSLLKTAVVAGVLFAVIQGLMPTLLASGGLTVTSLIGAAAGASTSLLIAAIAAGLILAAFDVMVVMRRNGKQTKMTKKELKDENKNSEGDPVIKGQRRSRQLAMSRNRMIAAIPEASVVLVNPTTYAVALLYEPGKSAPRVVAKGQGVIAARIREEAEKHGVPMVKDIPLTRALHAACELGEEIPIEYYGAIATVLTFVAALKARGSAKGVHSLARPALQLGGI